MWIPKWPIWVFSDPVPILGLKFLGFPLKFKIYLATGNTHSPHRRKHCEEWAESSGQPEPLHLSYLGYIQYSSPILWISPTPALSRLITVRFPSSSPGDGGCMWWTWLSFPEDSVPAVQQNLWWRWGAVARLRLEAGGRVLTKLTTLIYLFSTERPLSKWIFLLLKLFQHKFIMYSK